MAEWLTPIYDRTQGDVDYAIQQIKEWKARGYVDVTELKGCLNVSDINRIENNIRFLSEELTALYYTSSVVTKTWNGSTLPMVTEIDRVLDNVRVLISSFYQSADAPFVPNTMLHYEQINDIEENLYLLKEILDDMISCFRECGTFSCGEER